MFALRIARELMRSLSSIDAQVEAMMVVQYHLYRVSDILILGYPPLFFNVSGP
jgi:hypothetical protein